ncbi:MAG: DUF4172 domain-containing protein [Tannerella sp.]|nr:DUF4172 domain-containing protein [Tannerella sp.]
METYIWQQRGWPCLTWNFKELSSVLGEVRNRQGRLAGKMSLLESDLKKEIFLKFTTFDIIKSAELEGRMLDRKAVSLSVAQQLKLGARRQAIADPAIDRTVGVMVDTLLHFDQPVTEQRILDWKKRLSASGEEAEYRNTPLYRTEGNTEAFLCFRNASLIPDEMKRFIQWLNTAHATDPVIKAGVAHLRLRFIRPFEAGNGHVARTLTDLLLTRADRSPQRLYSLSSQICKQRDVYNRMMKKAQNGGLDITEWLTWFLYCLETELVETEKSLMRVLEKSKFWEKYRLIRLNERQVKMINLLWESKDRSQLTSSYWANINLCSSDTALRDIQDLIRKNILREKQSGRHITSYTLN